MFGLSIPNNLADCAGIITQLDSTFLPYLELQGDLLSERKTLEAVINRKLYLLNTYDYIKSSTIINSIDQSDMFQEEVLGTIETLLSDGIHSSLENITIDFGLFRSHEPEKILLFMQKLYYRLLQNNKNICLPITLPGMEKDFEIIQKTFYKLMLNRFKICLNIYPHEIKKEEEFSEFIEDLGFRVEFIRICYDAGVGNYITEKLLNYWLEIFKKCDINIPVIFAPSVSSIEMLEHEVSKICDLIKQRANKSL